MKDVKRTVRGQKSMAKASIPGKVALHPHTEQALKATAINTMSKRSAGGTGNGVAGKDHRY